MNDVTVYKIELEADGYPWTTWDVRGTIASWIDIDFFDRNSFFEGLDSMTIDYLQFANLNDSQLSELYESKKIKEEIKMIRVYNIVLVNNKEEEIEALWLQGYELTDLCNDYKKGWKIQHFDSMLVDEVLYRKYLDHINDDQVEYEEQVTIEWIKDCCSSDYPFYDSEEYPDEECGEESMYSGLEYANPPYVSPRSCRYYKPEADGDVPF